MISSQKALRLLDRLAEEELRDLFRALLQSYSVQLKSRILIRDTLDQLVANWHRKTGVRPAVLYVWFLYAAIDDVLSNGIIPGPVAAHDKICVILHAENLDV